MKNRLALAVLVLLVPGSFAPLAASIDSGGDAAVRSEILLQIVSASGVESDRDRERLAEGLQRAVERVVSRFAKGEPTYRKARRVHRVLHREYLRHYDEDADGIQHVLGGSQFNCLSASLFSAVVYRALGYATEIVEIPGHLFVELRIGGRVIQVETTSSHGFDVQRRRRAYEPGMLSAEDDLRWLRLSTRVRSIDSAEFWRVPLEGAVGFAWLNRAWRAANEGASVEAAGHILRASAYLPDLATRAQGVERLLSGAFSDEYEAGRFDEAWEVALVGLRLRPASTTARDRVLAAAVKRIEALCDDDAPGAASDVLDEVARLPIPAEQRGRLERGTRPLIAAAAVRLGDWDLARLAARRYAAAEPDRVEAERLASWVESRSRGAQPEDGPVCRDPRPGFSIPLIAPR